MILGLPSRWRDAIRAEGEKAYPDECCGVLLGRVFDDANRLVENIIPMSNAREHAEQYHRFQIEAEDLMYAEKEAIAQNRDVLGFYHSHPDHPARPSEYDLNQALPYYSYIIVTVEKRKAGELTSWRLSEDRKNFSPEPVFEDLETPEMETSKMETLEIEEK